MKLSRRDYEFNNPSICHVMPKHIELNRLLINLYMLLKYNGRKPVQKLGRNTITVKYVVDQLVQQHADKLTGFREHQDIVQDWIYSDLLDIVFRGTPDKEVVAAPMPLHINAYKLRNRKQSDDYGGSEHVYSMIRAADPGLVDELAAYLGGGMDNTGEYYDNHTPLDLDTLMVVRMVEGPHLKDGPSGKGSVPEPPLCICQARLMCDDLRRLLAYKDVVPRSVLIGYLRTAFGMHTALHLLKLFHQLPGWVRDAQAHPACLNCQVDPRSDRPFAACPYADQNPDSETNQPLPEIIVDMGEDYTSHMAKLARENCALHYGQMNDYIQAVFTVNQLFQYAASSTGRRSIARQPETVGDVLHLLSNPPPSMDYYFSERIDAILPLEEMSDERDEVRAVFEMDELSPLQKFVELVSLERTRFYRRYLVELVDQVLMKNRDTCLLRQGKGKRNERRWHLGSRLLEMLVQIAVLEPIESSPVVAGASRGYGFLSGQAKQERTALHSRPILIDEFITWMKERYGLVLMPDWQHATIQDYQAFNGNLRNLKDKLREIGFYTDLSDAYNTQTIRPRYNINS
ncbi:MAG: hypothetical protein ABI670_11235 [Chloroflexota bacterium]